MKKILCLVLLAILALSVAGCEDRTSTPYNVVCVFGIANNNPVLDTGAIAELSGLATTPHSTYTIINAESTPQIICSGTIPDFSDKNYTSTMMRRVEASIQADIINQIEHAQPCSAEIDIAAGTVQAVRALRSNQTAGRKNLLVYHLSGISTTGLINMVSVPVCELDIDSSVSTLARQLALDMSGIDVIMYSCGDVAGSNQNPLSSNEQRKLKDFYNQLFLTLGAESVTFMEDIPAGGAYDFDQPVTAMRTERVDGSLSAQVVPSDKDVQEDELEEIFANGDILSFDEKTLSFLSGSTELADSAKATEALSYVIDYMLARPDFELLICGTTTSAGTEESCMTFSEKRAARVRELLIAAGVNADNIHILGCGYSSLLYTPDRDSNGVLDETIAPQNRSVKMVAYGSDTAKQIAASLNPS